MQVDSTSDNDENSSDDALSVEKSRPVSLDKMIALVANLVERSRGTDNLLSLSTRDYNAIAGGKGFPFLYQQIKDNINPNQTRLLIHALCRYDERLAGSIIAMLFNAVTKHTEVIFFFKIKYATFLSNDHFIYIKIQSTNSFAVHFSSFSLYSPKLRRVRPVFLAFLNSFCREFGTLLNSAHNHHLNGLQFKHLETK